MSSNIGIQIIIHDYVNKGGTFDIKPTCAYDPLMDK